MFLYFSPEKQGVARWAGLGWAGLGWFAVCRDGIFKGMGFLILILVVFFLRVPLPLAFLDLA